MWCASAYYVWSSFSSHGHPPDATLTTELGVFYWVLGAAIVTEVCHFLTPPCTRITHVTLVEEVFFLFLNAMTGGFPVVTTIIEINARVVIVIVVMAGLGSARTGFTGASSFQIWIPFRVACWIWIKKDFLNKNKNTKIKYKKNVDFLWLEKRWWKTPLMSEWIWWSNDFLS